MKNEILPFVFTNKEQFKNKLSFIISRMDSNRNNMEIYYHGNNTNLFYEMKDDPIFKTSLECPEDHFVIRKIDTNEIYVYIIIKDKIDNIISEVKQVADYLNSLIINTKFSFMYNTDGRNENITFMNYPVFQSNKFKMDFNTDKSLYDLILIDCLSNINLLSSVIDKIKNGVTLSPQM